MPDTIATGADNGIRPPRCAVLVGPYLSGKTSLMESMLHIAGAVGRKGSVKEGNTVGDASAEARARSMSTEVNVAEFDYLGDRWTVLDCPGSIELAQEAKAACMAADIAVVVCEPQPERALTIAPLLHFLDEHSIPHMLFINKMDTTQMRVRDVMEAYQAVSARPLVLRQVPIRDGEHVTGYVDLISERAYRYQEGEPSELITIPDEFLDRKEESRQEMLEALADYDDALLEQLLEDRVPAKEDIYGYLQTDVGQDLVVPVLIGAGERDHGVRRLLKALRHDTPSPALTAERFGCDPSGPAAVQVFKTLHAGHAGKLSLGRVLTGTVKEGDSLGGEKLGTLLSVQGEKTAKRAVAETGQVVAIGRVESLAAGELLLADGGRSRIDDWPEPPPSTYSVSVHAENRQDEVKLSGALQKLRDDDPSLQVDQDPELHQLVLRGQGEQHVAIALDRLKNRFGVAVQTDPVATPYRETIQGGTSHHARFKRQSGGHGQFGDVQITVEPLGRGDGEVFEESVVGGAVPRQYIPAVESGMREAIQRGPLGFPVVDLKVTLTDGKHHSVDSSEQAFKTAGRMAVQEALANCKPVLLEPIAHVTVYTPDSATAAVQRLLSGRRGQILGYDAREGWSGWDQVEAHMPQAEIRDMIVELRSLTMGVGSFEWRFHHLQELSGRLADDIVKARQENA
ncbi:MAG: elongation factor G [Alphaproteobacteria bacterium]|nr:elongation factor G [Alphaproteobacteria bacterium]MCB9930588.1 elongation factor G [Alphaproteobacteria bacterium]